MSNCFPSASLRRRFLRWDPVALYVVGVVFLGAAAASCYQLFLPSHKRIALRFRSHPPKRFAGQMSVTELCKCRKSYF